MAGGTRGRLRWAAHRAASCATRRALSAACAIVALSAVAAPSAPRAEVLMTESEAVARLVGAVDRVVRHEIAIDAAQRARIADAVGVPVPEERFTFLECERGDEVAGWVFVGDEKGLYEPITFAVGISTESKVNDVEILVYRESRGGEVSRRRFLNQYRGKGPDSPLRLNQDVLNITGATVSSRSVTLGVKKALAAFRVLGVGTLAGAAALAD